MSETTNYKLYVADNDNTDFYDWWSQIGGPSGSNMEKIDTILAALDSLINTHTHNITVGISGVLGIENGGTGADTAADALANLGLTATAAELNYCDGVTSNIQDQLNKLSGAHSHKASDITDLSGTDYSTSRVRGISAGTDDLSAGTSPLPSGEIYLVYE